ncbi:hypothetical protein [Xylanibacillus composti]|uniref:Uncharacterized protein n=1 Tax=Xylanibacillus composti TaxID=1572762 RepID=A0A8J4H168_9BACL|nr:hypothetical protein [Xylanibacillus composti]GIQ69028.1 hypothetical protein XYCOK13_18520 [Xylanibacillus composti]
MSSKSTYLEQDLVNIIASMTFNIPNYPRTFYETGYRVEFIEKEFDINQNGKDREVKFDIVLNNKDKNHSIACECKSGGTEPAQLKKYSLLTSEELVLVGGVSSHSPSSHTHDTAIVCNSCNLEKIKEEASEYDFTYFSVTNSPTTISISGVESQDDDLLAYFEMPIEYPSLVHEVFRVGGQTPLFKYVKILAEVLVSFSIREKEEFTIADLAPEVASTNSELYPSRIGISMRRDIEKKISDAMDIGSKYELFEYIEWNRKKGQGKLKKIKTGCKPKTYKMFKEKVEELSDRLRKGEPVPKQYIQKPDDDPNQYKLELVMESE